LKRPVPVGDAKMSFTIKLSRSLIERLRSYAAATGLTLSEIVSRAVLAVLHRGGGRG
jgi:predicted transcriptional regulator